MCDWFVNRLGEDERCTQGRQESLERLLTSTARKKLIVAGPGTGKTYAFRRLLSVTCGNKLAITFINNLVRDLERELGDIAEVYTFHGFCRRLLHRISTDGITTRVDYYPPLSHIASADISIIEGISIRESQIEEALHNLDTDSCIIDGIIRSGNYYDSVGYADSVYRVLRHLVTHQQDIPSYQLIVVDEFQDFSLLEVSFISLLAENNPILVVGDDDQAIYEFRHASPQHLRDLVDDESYERFEFSYCSRCTSIIVEAFNWVVQIATRQQHLNGRIEKDFQCFLPDKRSDSERYPRIIYARCSVQTRSAPYMAKYIQDKILKIPQEDIQESYEDGYWTALITGPIQYVRLIYRHLSEHLPNVFIRESNKLEVRMIDGYRRLLHNPSSRLGWRVVMHMDPPKNIEEIIRRALNQGDELVDCLPQDYKQMHQKNVGILRKIRDNQVVSRTEEQNIVDAVGMSFQKLEEEIHGEERIEDYEDEIVAAGSTAPKVICTSLVGAKGLQAGHVFIVGLNEAHFPRDNDNPTDNEIRCFLVALTRAKKCCYLLSCGRFGNEQLEPSVFIHWVQPFIERVNVNKDYFSRDRLRQFDVG